MDADALAGPRLLPGQLSCTASRAAPGVGHLLRRDREKDLGGGEGAGAGSVPRAHAGSLSRETWSCPVRFAALVSLSPTQDTGLWPSLGRAGPTQACGAPGAPSCVPSPRGVLCIHPAHPVCAGPRGRVWGLAAVSRIYYFKEITNCFL